MYGVKKAFFNAQGYCLPPVFERKHNNLKLIRFHGDLPAFLDKHIYLPIYLKIMAQVTIYLPDQILKKINALAKSEALSVSSWVKNKLMGSIEDTWPEDYFDLFGSLEDLDLSRPEELDPGQDTRRTKL